MKNYLIFVLFIAVYLVSSRCTGIADRNSAVVVESKDTVVGKFSHSYGASLVEKFYLIIDGDTSDFYCTLKHIGYSGEQLRMEIFNDPKHSYMEYIIRNNIEEVEDKTFFPDTLTYEEQIQELKYILGHISKKYDLSKLEGVKFDVFSIPGLTSQIGETVIQQNKGFDYKVILGAIDVTVKKSSFVADLSTVLQSYGIGVDSTFISENKYLSGDLDFLKEIKRGENSKLRDSLLSYVPISAFISVRLKPYKVAP